MVAFPFMIILLVFFTSFSTYLNFASFFQSHKISGIVVSGNSLPIKDASVQSGRTEAVLTDYKGEFIMKNINSGPLRLIISAYDYKTLDTTINLMSDTSVKFVLNEYGR